MSVSRLAFAGCAAVLVAALGMDAASAKPPGLDPGLARANEQEVKAFLAGDPTALAGLWADDFLVTNPLNQVATKGQVLGMVRDGFLGFKSYLRRIEYSRRYGDLAILIGDEDVEWAGRFPLAGKVQHLRYTAIWRRQAGRWVEVARHANVVPPPAGPP